MSRVVVSEFQLKGLDRAARFAGEVFGSEEATGRECAAPYATSTPALLFAAGAVLAFCTVVFWVV